MKTILLIVIAALAALIGLDSDTVDTVTGEAVTAKVVRVADGDTITVRIDGREERVRYIGINTPEHAREGQAEECFAREATEANTQFVAGKTVTLVADKEDRDKYQRLLRYVYVDDVFVNEQMVREGYANTLFIPPNTRYQRSFEAHKETARAAEKGMWGNCTK